MGKEWLYKPTGGRKSSSMAASKTREKSTSSSGCMSAIFNLFDLQHHQFHSSFISESPQEPSFAGVEAPRNSLESPESAMEGASFSSKVKEQPNFSIPMGGIQIKTKRSRFTVDDFSSECSSSPGNKTPNLVARLMGLDLLPENSSPRPSSSSAPATHRLRCRSLPETPRTSTAGRRSIDIDFHHRLSLQIDKENCNNFKGKEHELLPMKTVRRRSDIPVNRREDESTTSQYAKQITKQVRERILRRVGADITNTATPATRRESNLVLLKPKRRPSPPPAPAITTKQDSSPKLRSSENKNNLDKPISNSSFQEGPSKRNTPPPLKHQTPFMKQENAVKVKKCKGIPGERYDLRLKQEAFVKDLKKKKKKKKSTPLSNLNYTTKFISFNKEMTSSSSTARLPQKQASLVSMTQLPSTLNPSYNANYHPNPATTATTSAGDHFSDHFDYISGILNQAGVRYSPPHPLNPSLFHQLEKLSTGTGTAGRRLILELVDELLSEILNPYMNRKPWVGSVPPDSYGSQLIGKLCERMRSFPATNCRVLEDIDALIDGDMGSLRRRMLPETEEIVREVEGEIMETLLHEIVTGRV